MCRLCRSLRVTQVLVLFCSVLAYCTQPTASQAIQTDVSEFQAIRVLNSPVTAKNSKEVHGGPAGGPASNPMPQAIESDSVKATDSLLQWQEKEIKSLRWAVAELGLANIELREAQTELRRENAELTDRLFLMESRLDSVVRSTPLYRLWRSTQGKTIMAALTNVEPDQVVLARNGKSVSVKLEHLCAEDRLFVAARYPESGWASDERQIKTGRSIENPPSQLKVIDKSRIERRRAELRGVGIIR